MRKQKSVVYKARSGFVSIFALGLLVTSGCVLGIKSRDIAIIPVATEAKAEIPYSLKIEFGEIQEKYGPRASAFILDRNNLEDALTQFMINRMTFPEGQVKVIDRNDSDLVLKTRIDQLDLRNTIRGFFFEVALEARLVDRDDHLIGVYKGAYSLNPKINSRFSAKTDNRFVGHIMNKAFNQICEQIERDFAEKKWTPNNKARSREDWAQLRSVLLEALDAARPEARIEAVRDLCIGMQSGHFEIDRETTRRLIAKFDDPEGAVRHEAVKALAKTGRTNELIRQELVQAIRSDGSPSAVVYAALSIADIGKESFESIPVLIDFVSRSFDVAETFGDALDLSASYGKDDSAIDFQMLKDRGMAPMQPDSAFLAMVLLDLVISAVAEAEREKTETNRVAQRYNQYYLDQCKKKFAGYIEKIEATTDSAGTWEHKLFKTTIKFRLAAVSYALAKITGQGFGSDQKKWREWWEANKGKRVP